MKEPEKLAASGMPLRLRADRVGWEPLKKVFEEMDKRVLKMEAVRGEASKINEPILPVSGSP